jgi:hypothetical protein
MKTKTDIIVTLEERAYITQLNGMVYKEPENKDHQLALNNYLKMLAMKYGYEDYWLMSEINPLTGEVFLNKPDDCCDEHIKQTDVEVEE